MFDVVCERGAGSVTVADVVKRSGVSRRTFYEVFSDGDDCFLAAFERALALARERVLPAYRVEGKWREQIRAGVIALLSFLDEQPAVGRLLICESLGGGERTLECRNRVLAQLAAMVDEGRGESVSAKGLPVLTAEGVVGGVLAILHARISQDALPPVIGLANTLTSMIVLPYLGSAAARRELDRPLEVPVSRERERGLLSDPFKDAGMRLTYRTVRVLSAIGELEGRGSAPSNRQVGVVAGIADQGQISKLLGRLQRIGVVSNVGLGPGQGAPNAWSLTSKGRRVVSTIHAHTNAHRPGDNQQ